MSGIEKTEFTFPDEVENTAAEKDNDAPEIEVVDDTPEEDRNRRPMKEAPADVTDEELSKYDKSVQSRLRHFSRGYHEERRAREAASREKEEALRFAQTIVEENKRLKGSLGGAQQVMVEQAQKSADTELQAAKRKLKEAQEAFDPEAIADAQLEMTQAVIRAENLKNFRATPSQERETEVQQQPQAASPVPADPKARNWQTQNSWFGQDDEMTSFALGYHSKLVKEGVDPRSDEYYAKLNKRLRQVFPDQFEQEQTEDAPTPRTRSNVAPATRSTAPRKVVLSQRQVDIAKRLGVPLELYAKKVAEEMARK